jgi:hypothetical protein
MRPSHSEVKPEDVRGRTETDRLLSLDPDRALHVARAIRHPWYRCQALSAVAKAQRSRPFALRLLSESLSAAYEQSEPNRIVSVASWPLEHLAKLDPTAAMAQVEQLLRVIATEPHGLRRLDGLTRMLVAVAAVPELRERVKPAFAEAAAASQGWRTERTVAFVASLLAQFDAAFAQLLVASRTPNRFVNRAAKDLQSSHGHGSA